jgi:glycosyltransferase involved in cell wall biosynthesis
MSNTGPLVTIVTPSFNTGRFIGDAVRSVLSQDYGNLEYLVMDGGSTDNTIEVLKQFDARCRWVSEKDKGQSDAVNKGFAKAKGTIFGWLNSDDTYAPGAVTAAVEFLWSHPDVDAVYGDANFIDAKGNVIAPCVHVEPYREHRLLHYTDFIVQPTVFFRRSAFEAVGGVDTSLHWCMDYDLWLKMVAKDLTLAYLPRHLANFRWLADNKTATGGWGRLREIEKVVKRYADGTHGYLRLEMVNQHLHDAGKKLGQFRLIGMTDSLLRAFGTYVGSGRAIRATFQPKTWKIIMTGKRLRRRALVAERAEGAQKEKGAPTMAEKRAAAIAAAAAAAAKGKPAAGKAAPAGKPGGAAVAPANAAGKPIGPRPTAGKPSPKP